MNTTRTALAYEIVMKNDGRPVGYRPPSRINTAGWLACGLVLLVALGWIALAIIQAPVPDDLVHFLLDAVTEPWARLAAWVGGY